MGVTMDLEQKLKIKIAELEERLKKNEKKLRNKNTALDLLSKKLTTLTLPDLKFGDYAQVYFVSRDFSLTQESDGIAIFGLTRIQEAKDNNVNVIYEKKLIISRYNRTKYYSGVGSFLFPYSKLKDVRLETLEEIKQRIEMAEARVKERIDEEQNYLRQMQAFLGVKNDN